jgi:hypothetical protein
MFRCRCGKLTPWIEHEVFTWCNRCGELVVTPTRSTMEAQGLLDGSAPPYIVKVESSELDGVLDGLEELLNFISAKQASTPAYDEENVREHASAYVFIRMLKQRLEEMKDA